MSLTIVSIAYPFVPIGTDTVGGTEQVLALIDQALVRHGHRSIVIGPRDPRSPDACGDARARPRRLRPGDLGVAYEITERR